MHSIKIKKHKLFLNQNIQRSPAGRLIKYVGLRKCTKSPEKWINGVLKNCWIYTFKFIDEQGGLMDFYFDYNDKFYKHDKFN